MEITVAATIAAVVVVSALIACGDSAAAGSGGLAVDVDKKSGGYRVFVGGTPWLDSAPTFFTVNGKRYSTGAGGGLKLVSVGSDAGRDQLGPWSATVFLYNPVDGPKTDLRVAFKLYRDYPDIVLFGQVFAADVQRTNNSNRNDVCTGFPSFQIEIPKKDQDLDLNDDQDQRLKFQGIGNRHLYQDSLQGNILLQEKRELFEEPQKQFVRNEVERDEERDEERNAGRTDKPELGFLAFGGLMFGDMQKRIGRWNSEQVKKIESGLDSGPLVLFSNSSGDAIVLSSFSQFMAASAVYSETKDGGMAVTWGVMGTVTTIPAHFHLWTIASYSSQGINKAISAWGEVLRQYYGRGTEYRDSDMTNNYIGFYTDNGAYYYYKTEPGMNYEKTLVSEIKYALQNNIPYRYIQYDSWFYYKGSRHGVTEWVAMPSIFPSGMDFVWNNTGLPVVAHNRWWSDKTVYAKQNGGKYDFVVETETRKALPTDQSFWDDLLQQSRKWGLIVYEQDWLNYQFDGMDATVSDVTLGRKWLLQMGKGARKNGLTIQYCMSPPRHMLQSLEIPVVSQARVSDDYQPGNDQWQIGVTSMVAHALGVAPFKDNFWTTTNQPGNPYSRSEPYPELQSVVATLSTGPVGPSDRINYSNPELIMRSCNADGLILKPSKPAMALDLQIVKSAFEKFTCEVWSTYSRISGLLFGIIFAADCTRNETVTISPYDAGFGRYFAESIAFSWFNPKQSVRYAEGAPLTLTGCKKKPFCLYMTSPVIVNPTNLQKTILYGELSKWVPISPKRVTEIHFSLDDIYVTLQGGSGERVVFSYSIDGQMSHTECVLSGEGTGTLQILSGKCLS